MAGLAPTMRACCARTGLRAVRPATRSFATTSSFRNQGPGTGENREQANDPTPRKETPNVSKTNELGVSAMGNKDGVLQETTPAAEKQRQMQAPNRAGVWSRSQQSREVAMSGPRFEQTIMDLQVGASTLQKCLADLNIAATICRNRAYPQATSSMGGRETSRLRWRWRPSRSPENIHKCRQATNLLVHILRTPIRRSSLETRRFRVRTTS